MQSALGFLESFSIKIISQVDEIPPEQHALVPAYMVNGHSGGKRIYPLPFPDSGIPGIILNEFAVVCVPVQSMFSTTRCFSAT